MLNSLAQARFYAKLERHLCFVQKISKMPFRKTSFCPTKGLPMNLTLVPHIFLSSLTILTLLHTSIHPSTVPATPPAKNIVAKTPKIVAKAPALTPSAPALNPNIPYLTQLEQAKMPQTILTAWQALYEQCTQANTTSQARPSASKDGQALAPLFTTNFFAQMAQFLDPKTFPTLISDPQGTIHTTYATVHLRAAAQRFAQIASIALDPTTHEPSIKFSGDVRDLGIIVNIQNNTDAQFSIAQVDGTTKTQISLIEPGMNGVNLHTAALQNNSPASAGTSTSSYFQITQSGAVDPVTISIKLMKGSDFVQFLRTLYRDEKATKKDTFEMNGLPTSPEYLANPNDWYLILAQNPTPNTATSRDPQQRIQAINITKFTQPYLLTLQINNETIEITAATPQTAATTANIYQPSIQTVLLPKNKTLTFENFPLLILPQFVWNLPQAQTYWMLQMTAYLATLTNNKLFGTASFGDAFEYFEGLGCFDMENKFCFIIDLYNLLKIGQHLYDANWLIALGLYETNPQHCPDTEQIYCSQNKNGFIIGNDKDCFYLNFQLRLSPPPNRMSKQKLFSQGSFNKVYNEKNFQLWTKIFTIPVHFAKKGILGFLKKIKNYHYHLSWTNKENKLINKSNIYLPDTPNDIETLFITKNKNWQGSFIPQINKQIAKYFRIIYQPFPSENKYNLISSIASPIDHNKIIHTTYLTKFPISDIYVDLYKTFKSDDFTRCYIIKDNVLPNFLENLPQNSWNNGILLILSIDSTPENPSTYPSLIATFYTPNKSVLGKISVKGFYKNDTSLTGIRNEVQFYTIYSNSFNPLYDLSLSTGLLLKLQ
jgi:hypothetical protein